MIENAIIYLIEFAGVAKLKVKKENFDEQR